MSGDSDSDAASGSGLDTKRCAHCGAYIPAVATMCASCGTSDVDGARTGGKPSRGTPRAPIRVGVGWSVTRIIIWINALYLLWCLRVQYAFTPDESATSALLSFSGLNQGLGATGAYSAVLVDRGQWWRIFTGFFLHAGIFHIGMNMWVLSRVGDALEELIGPMRYATIYLVSGIGSTVAVTVWFDWILGKPQQGLMVGASGAVFGVLGALAMYALRSGTGRGQALGRTLVRDIVFMLILGFLIEMVSNTGHIGGLIPGLLFGMVGGERFSDRLSPRAKHGWTVAAVLLSLITGVALAHGIDNSLELIGRLR